MKRWQLFAMTMILAFVAGCQTDHPPDGVGNSYGATGVLVGGATGAAVAALSSGISVPIAAVVGGITGGVVGAAMVGLQSKHDMLLYRLNQDHVKIVRVGEDFMLVLPSDSYFYRDSTHLNEAMYPALRDVTTFINHFDIETIKVAGYTDNIGDNTRNLALSRQQAQNVAKELWRDGIKATMIYSIGYGENYPTARNDTQEGRMANRRIQITFRVLTPGS